MTQETELRRPSNDLEVLRGQLTRELERLSGQGREAEEPGLYRAYLNYAQTLAWQGVARGELDLPGKVLDLLTLAELAVRQHRPELENPAEVAALQMQHAIVSLGVAVRALESVRFERRLEEPRSATERAVLRVLAENPRKYLGRKEVHTEMDPELRPTAPRVGQILAELYEEGLLIRILRPTQGSANASFYALSPRGRGLCGRLFGSKEEGLEAAPSPPAQQEREVPQALAAALKVFVGSDRRRAHIAEGLLQSAVPRLRLDLVEDGVQALGKRHIKPEDWQRVYRQTGAIRRSGEKLEESVDDPKTQCPGIHVWEPELVAV